ncbi:hypothetical protein CR513_54898, partial [Mucuna pruriens]
MILNRVWSPCPLTCPRTHSGVYERRAMMVLEMAKTKKGLVTNAKGRTGFVIGAFAVPELNVQFSFNAPLSHEVKETRAKSLLGSVGIESKIPYIHATFDSKKAAQHVATYVVFVGRVSKFRKNQLFFARNAYNKHQKYHWSKQNGLESDCVYVGACISNSSVQSNCVWVGAYISNSSVQVQYGTGKVRNDCMGQLNSLHILPLRKQHINIFQDGQWNNEARQDDIVLGPPSSGKATLMLAFAIKLDPKFSRFCRLYSLELRLLKKLAIKKTCMDNNILHEYVGCQVFGQTATTNHHEELTKIGINPSLKWAKASLRFRY